MKKIIFTIFFAIAVSLVQVPEVLAQSIDIYSEEDIFIESNPEIPGPNENVTIKLKSFSFNLNNYYIVWFKDGQKISSGFGNRELEFKTGPTGSSTNISATIEVGDRTYRKKFRFTPAVVDLIWESIDGFAPPFYKGKKIPVQQSKVRVTAIPETQLIAPKDAPKLVYYWDNNLDRDQKASGFGRNYYEFEVNPLLPEQRVTVTSNDRRENSFAQNDVIVPTSNDPLKTLYYEIDPGSNRLILNKAINAFGNLNKNEVQLAFFPLNFSVTKPNFTDLFVNWVINDRGQAPQDFSKQNELFATVPGGQGNLKVEVALEGIQHLLQKHTETISINLGRPN